MNFPTSTDSWPSGPGPTQDNTHWLFMLIWRGAFHTVWFGIKQPASVAMWTFIRLAAHSSSSASLNSFPSRFTSSLPLRIKYKMIMALQSMSILNANCELLMHVPSPCTAEDFISWSIHGPAVPESSASSAWPSSSSHLFTQPPPRASAFFSFCPFHFFFHPALSASTPPPHPLLPLISPLRILHRRLPQIRSRRAGCAGPRR